MRNESVKPITNGPFLKTFSSARATEYQPDTPALSAPMWTRPASTRPTTHVIAAIPHAAARANYPGRSAGR